MQNYLKTKEVVETFKSLVHLVILPFSQAKLREINYSWVTIRREVLINSSGWKFSEKYLSLQLSV